MEFVAGRREVLAYRQDYHGHADFAALVTGSPGENVNDYYNLPREYGRVFNAHGDLAAVENLFDRDIAAVIVEPMTTRPSRRRLRSCPGWPGAPRRDRPGAVPPRHPGPRRLGDRALRGEILSAAYQPARRGRRARRYRPRLAR